MKQDELAERDRRRAERKMLNARRQLRLLFWGALITIGFIVFSYWSSLNKNPEPIVTAPVPAPAAQADPVIPPFPAASAPRPKAADEPSPEQKLLATPSAPKPDASPKATPPLPATNGPPGATRNVPTTVEALGLWDRYLKAATPDERRKLMVEKPGLTERFVEYYTARKGSDPKPGDKIDDRELAVGQERWRVLSFKSDSRRNGLMSVAFRRDAQGQVRLDWESLVGHSEVAWPEFREKRVTEPRLFRGYVIQDDYFNFEFADEKKYLSFRVFSPEGTWALSGFCEKDSAEGRLLTKLFAALNEPKPTADPGSVKHLPVALRLAFPENAQSDHCVWIREIVGGQWFLQSEG